ncbi:MAG: gamma-glutamyltransferase [Rhodospirillales bacterium]
MTDRHARESFMDHMPTGRLPGGRPIRLALGAALAAVLVAAGACAPMPEPGPMPQAASETAAPEPEIAAEPEDLSLQGAAATAEQPAAPEPSTAEQPAAPEPSTVEQPAAPEPSTAPEPPEIAAVSAPPAEAEPEAFPAPAPGAPVRARRYMIAAANPLAAQAGLEMLRAGGSAVDAAIAAQMVLNLVEPQSSGLGGGGFMMHFNAKTGDIAAYDGRETAPAQARPDMFLRGDGAPMKFYEAAVGGLAVGVPGLLRMLEAAHRENGRLPWATLFAPAIRLAEEGFAVSELLHTRVARDANLKSFTGAANYFFDADGEARPAGTMLTNRRLAETLRLIARGGADAFYTGPIAGDIVRAVREARINPGTLRLADLAAYKVRKRDPVCLFYRVWLICGMGPPSSGGITTLQILGILQAFDLGALTPLSAKAVHLVAEASRLAFADRNTYIADPDFVPVPTAGMLDPGYLSLRAGEIAAGRSMGKAQPGMPGVETGNRHAPDDTARGVSTTHLSVVDANGNAVAMTTSIETTFGSRIMVRGFLLNNQLTDFSFRPERDGAPVANRLEPGKRPRSSMAPTLVFDGQGRVMMAVGSPGGSRIIGYVAKTLAAALDWKLDIQAAIDLPHFVNRNGPTELERGTPLEALAPALEALGHKVAIRRLTSGLHGIMVSKGGLTGGADKRREGGAMGD